MKGIKVTSSIPFPYEIKDMDIIILKRMKEVLDGHCNIRKVINVEYFFMYCMEKSFFMDQHWNFFIDYNSINDHHVLFDMRFVIFHIAYAICNISYRTCDISHMRYLTLQKRECDILDMRYRFPQTLALCLGPGYPERAINNAYAFLICTSEVRS